MAQAPSPRLALAAGLRKRDGEVDGYLPRDFTETPLSTPKVQCASMAMSATAHPQV
jgi:hypothetical protein